MPSAELMGAPGRQKELRDQGRYVDAIPFAKKALELGKNKGLLPVRLTDVSDHWDQGGKDDVFIAVFTYPAASGVRPRMGVSNITS